MHLFHISTQLVPRSKHATSVIKTKLLMMYTAKISVCSESHTKHKCNVISKQDFLMLNLVVRIVTGRLYRVNNSDQTRYSYKTFILKRTKKSQKGSRCIDLLFL
jgi:hypothetical protein